MAALLHDGPARRLLAYERVHVPHLIDIEVASALRRSAARGALTPDQAWAALDTWRRLAVTRYPVTALLDRVWELRTNVSAYDASYVALAEQLGCALVTADARPARAPGVLCTLTVVPG